MKFNWVDLILTIAILASFFRGYRAGLVSALLSAIGFVSGGLAGLWLVLHFVKSWTGVLGKFSLVIVAISVAAMLGEALFKRVGNFFHARIFFGPLRWLDSLAGAAFSLLRTSIYVYVITLILMASPWGWAHHNIPSSYLYQQMQQRAPALMNSVADEIRTAFRSPN